MSENRDAFVPAAIGFKVTEHVTVISCVADRCHVPEVWLTARARLGVTPEVQRAWSLCSQHIRAVGGKDVGGILAGWGCAGGGGLLIVIWGSTCGTVAVQSGECDRSSITVQNDGSLAPDQKQIGVRYVIRCTLFIFFLHFFFCLR